MKQACAWVVVALALCGCKHEPPPPPLQMPAELAATTQPAVDSLRLSREGIDPMYRELLAVDLSTVARVAIADNLEIRQAQARVEAARGRVDSSIQSLFPVVVPGITFEGQQGSARAVQGQLVPVDFSSLQASIAIQWIVNPTRVWYDIVAAKKRLLSAQHQQQFSELDTLRTAGVQYYELALNQAKVAAARQTLEEAQELSRIVNLKVKAGAGTTADQARANAALAARRQDLTIALNNFYLASVDLALTLRMDPSVTLVPLPDQLRAVALVRDDVPVETLLATAVGARPDLKALRDLVEASNADRKALAWSALAPQVQLGAAENGLRTHAAGETFDFQEQQKALAAAGWVLSLAALGQYKTASAEEQVAFLESARLFEKVRGQVIKAQQEGRTQARLIPAALEQLESARESLRLAQLNLRAGTMTTLDVLAAEDAVAEARVRHAAAVVRFNQAQVNLAGALGVLTPTVIGK